MYTEEHKFILQDGKWFKCIQRRDELTHEYSYHDIDTGDDLEPDSFLGNEGLSLVFTEPIVCDVKADGKVDFGFCVS